MDLSTSNSFKAENALTILTPWWDVVLKYITNAIMAIAFGTLPLQATKDTLACVVLVNCPNSTSTTTGTCELLNKPALSTFLNLACFQSLDLPAAFFSFILFGEAVVLLFASNIWAVLNPKSSLTLSHFISVVSECYDSIGTPEQISNVLEPGGTSMEREIHAPERELQPLLTRSSSEDDPELDDVSKSKIKTIYHKVKRFSDVQRGKKSLFFLYLFQQFIQVVFSCVVILVNIVFLGSFDTIFKCSMPKDEFLPMDYDYIACYRFVAPYYIAVSWVFIGFVCLYCLIATAVCFVMRMSANIPSFMESNDLDFLCFLLNQYSNLQYERFALFYKRPIKSSIKSHGSIIFS